MDKTRVIIRADGNALIGLGHLVRCLALAEMLRNEFHCVFVIQEPSLALQEQIMAVCEEVLVLPVSTDYQEEAHFIATSVLKSSDIVVLDNYAFTTEYQRKIISTGCKLVCIDDLADRHYLAHVVINTSGGISSQIYSTALYTELFLGPAFALLRRPFLETARNPRTDDSKNSLLICFGGADVYDNTLECIKMIEEKYPSLSLTIVVGSSYKYISSLEKHILSSKQSIELHSNIGPDEMLHQMSKTRWAILPPSVIAYEYSCTHGSLFLKLTAQNQKMQYEYLINNGFAKHYLDFTLSEEPNKSQSIIDGKSDSRILRIFKSLETSIKLTIRRGTMEDMMIYFNWANDKETRQNSINKNNITLSEHQTWFHRKIIDPNTLFFIFEDNKTPIGQVRIDIGDDGVGTINFTIDKLFRGKGYGKAILLKSVEESSKEFPHLSFKALVNPENIASFRIFQSLNFFHIGNENIHNTAFYVFVKEKTPV